jgi:aspartate ammonia-lyase
MKGTRSERDAIGEREVPADAYYGIHTVRAMESFRVSGLRAHPALIGAIAQVKSAAAQANTALGRLSPTIGDAVAAAAREVIGGRLNEQFPIDVFQAGAGVTLNATMNEVLANRALEILGEPRGRYAVIHPADHVNLGQSAQDVIPTAMRLATLSRLNPLLQALAALEEALRDRARAFESVVKAGRVHLQDGPPMRLGQEFGGYATAVAAHQAAIGDTRVGLRPLGIGGTAVGTGLNVHPDYRRLVVATLSDLTGEPLATAPDLFDAMQSLRCFAATSGALRGLALDLVRICRDLMLLASGPYTGFGEITLPVLQPDLTEGPGSSGPAIPEMVTMACFQVIGADSTVALAAQAGQLEANAMTPVVAHSLLHAVDILARSIALFIARCVSGIQADVEQCRRHATQSAGLTAALAPRFGAEQAAALGRQALATHRTIREVVEQGGMAPSDAEELLDVQRLSQPGLGRGG